MNQVANEKLNEVKTQLSAPNFKEMSIMDATQWCLERGYEKPSDIVSMTGKTSQSVYTALWKIRNPKRVKVLQRRAKRKLAKKKMVVAIAKAKPTTTKTKKPVVKNGFYDDGMETPFLDALNRKTQRFNFLDEERQPMHELMAENRRLKILVDHYEALLFAKGMK